LPERVKNRLFVRRKARRTRTRLRVPIAAAPGGGRLRIALRVSGGLGDFIVIARFIRDLAAACEEFEFDVFATNPKVAAFAFSLVSGYGATFEEFLFRRSLGGYDLALIANQTVLFDDASARWDRIASYPLLARALHRMERVRADGLEIFVERHPYFDGFMARRAVYMNESRRTFLHHMAGLEYKGDRLVVPAVIPKEFPVRGPFVTVHNGFDTSVKIHGGSGRHTKCWPHFTELVALLKEEFPALPIVQLGSTTSEPIPGVGVDLIDKTSFPEVAAILAASAFHFDNESGLVHLAAAQGTMSAVMFGPTPVDFFSYPGNVNVAPEFCGGCWWTVPDWMDACPRGFDNPLCLRSTSALRVMNLVRLHLAGRLKAPAAVGSLPVAGLMEGAASHEAQSR